MPTTRNSSESSVGVDFKGVSKGYIPLTSVSGSYSFDSRCFSILNIKYSGSSRGNSESLLGKRIHWLQSNLGLSSTSARIFLGRRRSDIRRIEDTVHAIIDSLLLFDQSLFLKGSANRKVLLQIVRKTLVIATYSVGDVMKLWKEFTAYLYNKYAGLSPTLPSPSSKNFFWRCLHNHPDIVKMVSGSVDRFLSEKFAHLTSTRHFASGDRRAERDSLKKFFSTIEEPWEFNSGWLESLSQTAERVGERCRNFSRGINYGLPHVSLNSAGSYYSTVKDGGRGKEIREALKEVLDYSPTEDEIISTPFGDLSCPKGKERWRYWCRKVPYTWYENIAFGDTITEEVFNEIHPYHQGFDEAIGDQILITAYIKYREWGYTGLGIPCRVLTVPEPGYKARIVTTGPFWLTVLQQSVAHSLKASLSGHPSAKSGMMKTDQAWQALYVFENKCFPEGSMCLSSDLSEATDVIPKEVAISILMGYVKGLKFKSNTLQIAMTLLQSHREFTAPGYVSLKQTRGVMMGEPLTKVVLTLLNLVVEEYAMRTYLKISLKKEFYKSPSWRAYHVGGDDHLAGGPLSYLQNITKAHLLSGSKISVGKHGVSSRVVKYCEKVLEVKPLLLPFLVADINRSTKGYEESPFVDSIKVRLLSPLSKAFEVSSERNIAIGKGLSLGRTLKWMNPDHFSKKWIRMVRDRFFQRMGSLLPDRDSGCYWQLLLPTQWGGLDLYIKEDIPQMYSKVPILTKEIMASVMNDEPYGFDSLKLLRKLLSNYSYRGFVLEESEVSAMKAHIEQIIEPHFPRKTWKEIKAEFDPEGQMSAKSVSDQAWKDGWKLREDIEDELMRPILFKEILLGNEKSSPYNTEPIKRRYAKLWDLRFRGEKVLDYSTFEEAIGHRPVNFFFKVGYPEEIHFESDRGYLYKSALDDALNGMPVLRISSRYA